VLAETGIESYLGVPLRTNGGTVLGHLAVFDERPMPEEERRLPILQTFAQRAAAELERLSMEQRLVESEQRFRDLFEEAPIPYVYEDTESRFVHANRAFMQLLGLKPEDVPGTTGLSLVPTDDSRDRAHACLASEQVGVQRDAIELELRRKDDGRPVWVQRWSRPEPDGRHTRTMIIDITARVLAEREQARLQQQNRYLQEEIRSLHPYDEIVGCSTAIRAVLSAVEQVAATDATVLVLGESGTGKELIARAIHARSPRRNQPLIKVNCSAIPAGLVESELFGHERGAFTGATARRVGRFTLADGGTILLDEIGDMPPEAQLRLLRVLQENEFEPVGSSRTLRVDVRVIAATNRDLERSLADGSFRSDLFYRLNVFPIHAPALRDRPEDIALLSLYFLDRCSKRYGKSFEGIEPASLDLLRRYPWPGNVRELANVLERAVILGQGGWLEIPPEFLGTPITPPAAPGVPADPAEARHAAPEERDHRVGAGEGGLALAAVERSHIEQVLDHVGWVIEGPSGAAAVLRMNPSTLRSRMKKLGLRRARREISREP
jgi:PAS domain S-box-containing protein